MAGNELSSLAGVRGAESTRPDYAGARSASGPAAAQQLKLATTAGGDGRQPMATGVPPASGSDDLVRTVQQMNEMAQAIRREIRFTIDDSTGRTVINVIDAETDDVVRQIPSEEVLTIAARLKDEAENVLVDTQA